MAILKMKKLRLIAVRSRKEELLNALTKLGCVELTEPEITDAEGGLQRESSDLMSLRAQLLSVDHAIYALDKTVPEKKGLLTAAPLVESDVLLSSEGISRSVKLSEDITHWGDRIKRISGEESRQRSLIESLKPWLELDMPLQTEGTERTSIVPGSINAKISLDDVDAALEEISGEAELFRISGDGSQNYVLLVAAKECFPAMQECLRGFGFTPGNFSGMTGTARECSSQAYEELKRLAAEKEDCLRFITDSAVYRDELKLASDRLQTQIAKAQAEEKLAGTRSTLVLEGWMPEENEEELAKIFEEYECAWESEEPAEEEYPSVPVKLKNNKITNALNMVTEMYSLPAYGSLDPNPLMAPFFILFYGLMMADMGYGLIMIIAAVVALKKIRPKEGTLSFCQLLLYSGISTFIMGALTGGFFGNALEQIGKIIGKPEGWGVLPALFNPMQDSMVVLIGAIALGLVHLNTGMVINFIKKLKQGQIADAIWEEGSLWVILIGGVLFAFNIGNVSGVPVVLVIGLIMLFYGGSRSAQGMGKLLSIFTTLYNTSTGWFGDLLSYSRIMALMLAGSVIATVFNTIGAIANNLVFFFVIFIIGHALNFALNLLGCYVHDLRLQCLEYFGKFYEDGGRPFNPLKFKTKFYDVAE